MHYRAPEGEEKKGLIKYLERIAENFINMGKEIVTQVLEVQSQGRMNTRRNMMRHIVIKLTKLRNKNLIFKKQGKATNHT